MKTKQNKKGLTLVEILVAIAIVAVLGAGLYIAGDYADKQAKIKFTQSTIEMLSAALEQYRDFYGKFPFQAIPTVIYNKSSLEADLASDTGGTVVVEGVSHKDEYSSSEALCYFFNKSPDAKKIIASLNPSLLTNKGPTGEVFTVNITVSGVTTGYPLVRIVDSWGTAFRYTYTTGDNFPVITSAGPDRNFNKTDDNITSR